MAPALPLLTTKLSRGEGGSNGRLPLFGPYLLCASFFQTWASCLGTKTSFFVIFYFWGVQRFSKNKVDLLMKLLSLQGVASSKNKLQYIPAQCLLFCHQCHSFDLSKFYPSFLAHVKSLLLWDLLNNLQFCRYRMYRSVMLEGYIKQLRSWILMPNAEIRTPALSFTSSVTWVVYLTSLNCRSVTYERTTVISTHKVVVRIKAYTHTHAHALP